ncbi:MAG: hypothetical protein MH204_01710 [Fimbriimonadaceae bacterium]|nr:hypothetical protein [Fimbriimonadaceae bacterium]
MGRLIAVLVGVAVLIGLILVFTVGSPAVGEKAPPRADGKGETVIGRSALAAKDTVCRENLRQIRAALQAAAAMSVDEPPQSLDEVPGIASIRSCPVGETPYVYDPQSGTVSCPHPGHESH